ncbi:UDP-3-O-(3-hydroxymyristoyl)glucosamine N-acyltransferase [Jannaschia sp. CCS1]|uniref:UDP-3-O-(3-hydroxymyristoyl)glucosamine N-acyltransferase n=1 Tax=Jannaschia sp. (strain CCS1) TaxID=290400 RepID=UPI000053C568|nr:UDP-3-O-(3-hydroxymyristoyl)glucosamine N-acyltransferase [Jannaschia sp. CCS1]ABD55063.1 UDP-3-O-[3-hydroxymyristoyl] glucosamine N-acyltransferase [Jannaschia sp. CCS1]
MAEFSVRDIAAALGAEVLGAADLFVSGVAEPAAAGSEHLALAMRPEYADGLAAGNARVAVIGAGMDWQALGLDAAIIAPRPRYAMAGVTAAMDPGPDIAPGVHPMAVVDATAEIGEGAAIGPFVVIGKDVRIGARVRIASHVSIQTGAVIGEDALLHEGVRICHRVQIGDRFIAQPGAVLGGDGFSFVTPQKSQVEAARESLGTAKDAATDQSWVRIHSLGSLIIGDDVEVGANAAIDRGTIAHSRIGDGTKVDNLVHIGHNCVIGRDCLICGQTGFAGSVQMGDRVVLGGKCGVSDNITIGSDVVAAGASKLFTNVPSGRMVMGHPAVKMDTHVEMYKALRRLPRTARAVAELQKAVSNPDKTP